jgi:DNA-binding PadR family transcriptional regulator
MKRWADIGNSTIYKVLKDLEHDRALRGKKVVGDKGPLNRYSLTARGRKQLTSTFWRRSSLTRRPGSTRVPACFRDSASQGGRRSGPGADNHSTTQSRRCASRSLSSRKDDIVAEAIVQFYIDVFEAETRAIEKVSRMFR